MINVSELLKKQMRQVGEWHQHPPAFAETNDIDSLISRQNYVNYQLWHEEDLARDPDASDQQIAAVKRRIDQLNQKRHNLIEQIDECLLHHLNQRQPKANSNKLFPAEMNSETPGSVIDRLFIGALKVYHMQEEAARKNASLQHREKCAAKVKVLEEQRLDLAQSLENLWRDLQSGQKILKIYRQMKMYNDETLNPVLYQKKNSLSS